MAEEFYRPLNAYLMILVAQLFDLLLVADARYFQCALKYCFKKGEM